MLEIKLNREMPLSFSKYLCNCIQCFNDYNSKNQNVLFKINLNILLAHLTRRLNSYQNLVVVCCHRRCRECFTLFLFLITPGLISTKLCKTPGPQVALTGFQGLQ